MKTKEVPDFNCVLSFLVWFGWQFEGGGGDFEKKKKENKKHYKKQPNCILCCMHVSP